MKLEAEPLPLPWREDCDFAELFQRTDGTDGIWVRAYAEHIPRDPPWFEGHVDVTGPLSSRIASAYRPVRMKSQAETRRECEAWAGLLLAAFGLARPEVGRRSDE